MQKNPVSVASKTADSDEYSKSARSNAIDFEDNPYLKISEPKNTSH